MTASDDARKAIALAAVADADKWQGRKFGIDAVLAAVMPDGRTIAQHLDDGAALEAAVAAIPTWGHGEKLTDMTSCRCGLPHPCPTLQATDLARREIGQ